MAKSSNNSKYDVFLSFRGEDIRHTFTGYLYDTFSIRGIKAFCDDQILKARDEISLSVLKAIEESRISVIVFSENYASSTCCLDELVKIHDCSVKKGQHLLPIFYKVNPSDVRNQRNSYGRAMAAHEIRFGKSSERVLNWRSALTVVATLNGYHLDGDEYEHVFIEKIVKAISIELSREVLHVGENTVGVESNKRTGLIPRRGYVKHQILRSLLESIRYDLPKRLSRTKKRDEFVQRQSTEDVGIDEKPERQSLLKKAAHGIEKTFEMDNLPLPQLEFHNMSSSGRFLDISNEGIGRDIQQLVVRSPQPEIPGSFNPKRYGPSKRFTRTKKRDEFIQRQLTEYVGIDERCEHIELLLEKFSKVCICGLSGIGKTTIAKVVFAKLSAQFERFCFFENVREEYKKHGPNYLCDKLLYELLKEENPHISRPIVMGSTQFLRSLDSEKVLIVLDDVDDSNLLAYLTKEFKNYLRPDSRVILTTRNKNLLASVRVDKIYEVKELNFQESLQLFSLHAFNQNSPEIGYEESSIKVVVYCKGIPLALKVLGSFLRSKTRGEWERVLEKIEMIPNNDIQDVLRLSFDGLDSHDKEIFLGIACFWNGKDKDKVVDLLEDCGFSASVGITTLLDRALLTISDDNKVWMHDLIHDLGQKIVHERCFAESHRLWHPDDTYDALNEKWKTNAVEGLPLDVSQIKDLRLTANTFKSKLTPRMLDDTNVERIFDIGQGFVNLRSNKRLIELPDLSKVPIEIESFDAEMEEDEPKLRDSLIEVDMFNFGSSFETVKVTDESQLKELPPNLHSLRVVGCHLLESLPDELMNKTSNVSDLYAIDCPSLKYLGGRNFTSLRTLYIHNCRKLEFLLSSGNFAYLEHLCMGNSCDSLEYFTLNHFPKLKTLCIWNFPNLESLLISEEFEHGYLPLESLEIRDCPDLVSLPRKGLPTPNLLSLTLSNCIVLRSLPNRLASLESLQTIFIDRCPELDSLPEGGFPSSLSLLSIAFCDKLIPKKEWELNRLHSLTRFEIEGACVGMESFPEKDLLPSNLNSLRISNLLSLSVLDYEGLQQLTALQSLDINCCHKLSSFPEEGQPSSLTSLSLKGSPLLTPNLMHKLGADWCKIAHIPNIRINKDFISSNSEEVSFILGNGII